MTEKLLKFEEDLSVNPGNRNLLASAIDTYLTLGRVKDAKRYADEAVKRYPNDQYFQFRHGNVLIANGELSEAKAIFERLFIETGNSVAAFNLAYVCYEQAEYDEAGKLLTPIVSLPDRPAGSVVLLLRVLHRQGNLKTAITLVQRNMELCKNETDFLAVASLLFFDDGQLENARRTCIAAQVGGARPLEAMIVSASVSLGDGDIEAAKIQFTEAIEICPTDGRSWGGLGMISMLKGDLPLASQQLEKAIGYMPNHIGTRHLLGWCKIFSHDLIVAHKIFDQALSLDRNFAESHGGLAAVLALQGERNVAEECIKRAIRLDPKSLSVRYAQAVLSGEINDPEKFREIAFKAMSTRVNPFGGSLAAAVRKLSTV